MKNLLLLSVFSLLFSLSIAVRAEGFTLSSPDIAGQLSKAQVFNAFGCSGENISPKLAWKNAPKGTKSYALTVYDPDAPTGSGWWHWVMFNIPADTHSLKADAGNIDLPIAPKGSIQSTTSFGGKGFGGACPPEGDSAHQYIFTVYALGVEKLDLDAEATPALVGFYLNANVLAKASLIAYYGR
ncbi:MAG: YbhB/YbcL family Raf kinase inhibitor-like protein [Cellvibrionaceae bacterium]|nr:YbhB/YbcL family Raf kinase inhibitor-like protein [Cellvibrionaceae bacterium]